MEQQSIKEDLRAQRTKKYLSTTLLNMIQEESIKKISVSDICEKAMIHRTTFYKHFEDKYHLLSYTFETIKDAMFESMTKDLKSKSLTSLALEINRSCLEFLKNRQEMITKILTNNTDERFLSIIVESFERSLKEFLTDIKTAKNVTYEIPISIVTTFIVGGFSNTILWYLKNPNNYSIEELYSYNERLLEKLINN